MREQIDLRWHAWYATLLAVEDSVDDIPGMLSTANEGVDDIPGNVWYAIGKSKF